MACTHCDIQHAAATAKNKPLKKHEILRERIEAELNEHTEKGKCFDRNGVAVLASGGLCTLVADLRQILADG